MKKIIILLTCAILLCGCGNGNMVKSQKTSQNNEQKYTSELFAMDTYMEITAYGDNAKEAVAKASARINELDGMLSTGNSDSEVSKLNSEKKLKLSEDVGNIMERSLEISESTGGVFNPAIYPIMQLSVASVPATYSTVFIRAIICGHLPIMFWDVVILR